MRRIRFRSVRMALAAAMLMASPAVMPAYSQSAPGPVSVADLAEGLLDAVVNISTSQNVGGGRTQPRMRAPEGSPFQDFFDEFFSDRQGQGPRNRKVSSLGSGFVIDAEEGIIVTNNHVIEGADDIEVNFADGSKLKAELVGADSKTDLAVLKVEPVKPLTEVPLGKSEQMRIGDWVMAIGNPFGLGGTVTVGIISARGRDINSGPYDNFIQTDAAINRGNSGGPLFNMYGEVIGINTAIISPSGGSIGIGFAVPSELAVNVIDQLARVRRDPPRLARRAHSAGHRRDRREPRHGESHGCAGRRRHPRRPGRRRPVEPGDVIIRFDGKEVDTCAICPAWSPKARSARPSMSLSFARARSRPSR
jgi:serine protease Do